MHGASMGSPLSPVMANLFRYVDDTLSSWAHGLENLHRFLEHINSLHPSIKFTLEMEKEDKSIPFLNVLLLIQEDSIVSQ